MPDQVRHDGFRRAKRLALCIAAVSAYLHAMTRHSPIVSEFDTPEQAAAYEEWLAKKVAASLADGRPPVPHDEVMAEVRAIIAKAKQRRSC